MTMRIATHFVSFLCAWILWEQWSVPTSSQGTLSHSFTAKDETKDLADCQSRLHSRVQLISAALRNDYPDPGYAIITKDYSVTVAVPDRLHAIQMQYRYMCLIPSMDPRKD